MSQVYNVVKERWEYVKKLRIVRSARHPDLELFAHRMIKGAGYAVSEKSTGASIYHSRDDRLKDVILKAIMILERTSKKRVTNTIKTITQRHLTKEE